LQITSDQSTLLSVSNDKTVRIWNLSTFECLQVLSEHSQTILRTFFEAEAETLIPPLVFASVVMLKPAFHRWRFKIVRTVAQSVNSISLADEDKLFITGSDDKTVKIWKLGSDSCIRTLEGHEDEVLSVIYLSKCKMIASSSQDKTVRLWNLSTGECLKILQTGQTVACLCYGEDKDLLIGGTSSSVMMWDINTLEKIDELPGTVSTFNSISLTSDSETLALASYNSGFSLWNVQTKSCLKHLNGSIVPAYTVAMIEEDRRLVSSSNEKIIIWDFETGQVLRILSGHEDVVWEIDVSPCGKLLASTSADKTAKVWSLETGKCLYTLKGHTGRVYSVSFSLNGYIATASADGSVRLWDARNGSCLNIIQGHTDKVWEVKFSPDGCLLCSGSRDQTIKMWDITTGSCVRTFEGCGSDVGCIAFSKTGSLLESGGHDQIIRLWDLDSGKCISTLHGHTSRVNSLIFDSNSRFLITILRTKFEQVLGLKPSSCREQDLFF